MKNYKAPKGFTKCTDDSKIYDGAVIYLDPMYVDESESPRRYVVMEMPSGTFLLADDKRMYKKGEGYLYGRYSIAYYKNPQ